MTVVEPQPVVWAVLEETHKKNSGPVVVRAIFTVEAPAHVAAGILNQQLEADGQNVDGIQVAPGVGIYAGRCFLVFNIASMENEIELGTWFRVEEWATNRLDGAKPTPEKTPVAPSADQGGA